ncbi:ParA family protein [Sorangium sp. So ce764]|uniref:ParA family protein n=1 Tax=Sorangium sp. So ce764 TaxID=3133320 RepID=UPI003F5EE8BB
MHTMNHVRIAFLNSKGGVGKTTSAVNTAAALAELGHSVLLLDMDPQSHVASHFGLEVDPAKSVDAVLQDPHGHIETVIQSTPYANLDVVLSTGKLEEIEKLLLMRNQPIDALRKTLQGARDYQFVLIDCAPGLGVLSRNAMRASDYLVIPTDLDKFSVDGMDRLGNVIAELHEDYPERPSQVLGVLVTKFNRRQLIENRANYSRLETSFGGDEIFFRRKIRIDERCKRATREHRPALSVKGSRAAEDYRALALEFLERLEGRAA